MTKEVLKLALEALENSVDLVVEDAYNAEQLYGKYPTRQGKIGGLKVLADQHKNAITAVREALAQPEQPEQEPVDPADIIAGALQTSRAYAYELMERAVLERHSLQPAAQAEPVKPVGRVKIVYGTPSVDFLPGQAVRQGDLLYGNPYPNEVDQFLTHLNLEPSLFRTKAGGLNVPKICEYIRDEKNYTTPQPAAQAERQPLTTHEIEDLWGAQIFNITDLSMAIDFVRDIEAAHGIKEQSHDQ